MNTARKLWSILNVAQKRSAISLLSLMLVGMLLEMLGIGLVIPALALFTQEDLVTKYPYLGPLYSVLGDPGREELVIIGMMFLVSVYAIKTLFLAFLAWKQTYFVYNLQANLSQQLFNGYLKQPYTFHLQRNSAQLIRNVLTEISILATVNQSLLTIIAESLVLLGIMMLLMAVEPIGAASVLLVLCAAGWTFYRITKNYIRRWGEARQYHEGQRIQHLQQGLGGAKDVKLLGREDDFLSQYQLHNEASARVGQRQSALQQLPRLWLELLAVVGLAVLVYVMLAQNKPLDNLLPILGVFAAAAFRLMPSVNRVLMAMQNMRYAVPVITTIYSEIQQFKTVDDFNTGKELLFDKILTIDNISFQYENSDKYVLNMINISIERGTTVGFIGGSGAGKSTLVDIILGLLLPLSGNIKVDGIDIRKNMRGWQDQIGYVPQAIFLTDDTLRRNIAFGVPEDKIDDAAVWKAVQSAQLEHYIKDLPNGVNTVVGERGVRLSGGQRQRIGIARALYHDPEVLVLDEATSSLDSDTEKGIVDAVNDLHGDKTILIVAHRLSTVEHCDKIYRLNSGKIVDHGTANMVLSGD